MAIEPDHKQVPTNAARGGETPHVARYILMFSVALVVVAFAILLIIWS